LCYHETAVESAVLDQEGRQSGDASIHVLLNASLAEPPEFKECKGQKVCCFGNVLSVEVASRYELVLLKAVLLEVNKWIISGSIHLFLQQSPSKYQAALNSC
jgi:hypothetical protein